MIRPRRPLPRRSPGSDRLRLGVGDRVVGAGVVFLGEEAYSLQGGHAAHTRRGHGLTVDIIGYITRREYAPDRRGRPAGFNSEIAGGIHGQLAGEQGGGRRVAYGDKDTVAG